MSQLFTILSSLNTVPLGQECDDALRRRLSHFRLEFVKLCTGQYFKHLFFDVVDESIKE